MQLGVYIPEQNLFKDTLSYNFTRAHNQISDLNPSPKPDPEYLHNMILNSTQFTVCGSRMEVDRYTAWFQNSNPISDCPMNLGEFHRQEQSLSCTGNCNTRLFYDSVQFTTVVLMSKMGTH